MASAASTRARRGSGGLRGAIALVIALSALGAGLVHATPAQAGGPEPILFVPSTTIEFEPTLRSTGHSRTVTLRNLGQARLDDLQMTSSNPAFVISGQNRTNSCTRYNFINPTNFCTFYVSFMPTVNGVFTGTIDITSEAGNATIAVSGAVSNNPFPIQVTPSKLDFGDVAAGAVAQPQSVVLTNTSAASVSFTATPPALGLPFSQSNGCSGTPRVLAPNESCTVSIGFAPKAIGATSSTKNLQITGAFSRTFPLQVSGSGVAAGTAFPLRVSPTALDFGDVPLGTTSAPQSISVTNTSATPVSFTATGGSSSVPFAGTTTCGGAPTTLAPGATCTYTKTFSPVVFASQQEVAPLHLAVNGGSTRTWALQLDGYGRGDAPHLSVPFLDYAFPPDATGTTAVEALTVTNVGEAASGPITVTDPGAPFSISLNTCTTLAKQASCEIRYSSIAGAVDSHPTATSTISNGVQSIPITLNSNGPPAPPVGVDDDYLVFKDTPFHIPDPADGLFANDQGVALRRGGNTRTTHGDVDMWEDGHLDYTPDPGFEGTDTFTYWIYDLVDQGSSATVTFTVRSPHPAFVKAAHADFLDRGPTTTELSILDGALEAGTTTRPAILDDLATSPEWIGVIVDGLYQDTLGRPGDPSGAAYWTGQLQAGKRTVAEVAARFYASGEYFRGIGGNANATWIDDLYLKLLGRPADPGGKAYWVGQTNSKGRVDVAHRFFQSLESRRTRVARLYQGLLDRAPDSAGRDFWAGRVLTQGDIALAVDLASSNEYLVKAQARFP